jgi:hypothetical protein
MPEKASPYHFTRASSVSLILGAAGIGLVLGLFVYVLDRQLGSVYIIPNWLEVMGPSKPVFGLIGEQIPTFVHTLAFSLLTYALLAPTPGAALLSAITWLSIGSFFEIAQASAVAHWISSHSPDWLASIPFLENIPGYFLAGTFDPLDLVSIAAGAVLAYLIARFSQQEDKS